MIGIIIALHSEAQALLEKVENLTKVKLLNKDAYTGKINGRDVIIAISGIGKVNAGFVTQMIIDKFSPDFILNFGTCGGLNNSVEVLNYYAIEKCCQYDFDLTELDPVPLGYIQDYDTVFFPASTIGLETLKPDLKITATVRLDNPEETLTELAERLNVSKSCLNHRLRKLVCIANEL